MNRMEVVKNEGHIPTKRRQAMDTRKTTLMFHQTRSQRQEKQHTLTFQQTVLFFNHTSLTVIIVYVNVGLVSL